MKNFTNLTKTRQWNALQQHYDEMQHKHMCDLFLENPKRANNFYLEAAGLSLDYSKNHITYRTMELLSDLAAARDVGPQIESLFSGDCVNCTEQSAALHTALRNMGGNPIYVDGVDVMPAIQSSWKKIQTWAEQIVTGGYQGYSGKKICNIVNIGVGGSDLGPMMVYHALKPYTQQNIQCHFISNQDKFHLYETLNKLNPETTLFIITSKSFTTKETIANANLAKEWLIQSAGDETKILPQFIAVTSQKNKALEYGILPESIFPLWKWVGGRYSIWSSVGLTIVIAIGMENFKSFLKGAYDMDQHFREAEFMHNMPVVMALLTVWYSNFFHAQSRAIIPYSQQLLYLPDYLKQLHMESQGKSIQRNGEPVDYSTGIVIWGGVGSNSQHSFHQLFLQGNQLSPIDFILPLRDYRSNLYQFELIANCLSQSETLMQGYSIEQALHDLREQGLSDEAANLLAPHKKISGNYPSNTIFTEKITPYTLGALLALYEHKVYVQSLIWNINAFDQWGVERGKKMADKILQGLREGRLNQGPERIINKILQEGRQDD